MDLSNRVMSHLRAELNRADPWRLTVSDFEQRRYECMRLLMGEAEFESGLEVGCAAGAFSEHLVDGCRRLRIVDVLPEAIDRTRQRLGDRERVSYAVAQISDLASWGETYDLVVVAEVLYYITELESVHRTVAHLSGLLRPGGVLIFGSAIDSICARWGLPHGAETAMKEWSKHLREVKRAICIGATADEHAMIVRYARDA